MAVHNFIQQELHEHKNTAMKKNISILYAFIFIACLLANFAFGSSNEVIVAEHIKVAISERSLPKLLTCATELKNVQTNAGYAYFDMAWNLLPTLQSVAQTNSDAKAVFVTVLRDVLVQGDPTNPPIRQPMEPISTSYFDIKNWCALNLYDYLYDNAKPTFEVEDAKLFVMFLGEVRNHLIDGYKPVRTFVTVMPPLNSGQGTFPGMEPTAIKDLGARAEYEQAIETNELNKYQNRLQTMILPKIESDMKRIVFNYLKLGISQRPDFGNELSELMTIAKLTEAEKKEVIGQ
jgi:hypothetical protein